MLSLYLSMLDSEGEKARFEDIYYKYAKNMGKLALSMLKDEDAAFNALHNAFFSIAKNFKSFPNSKDERYERSYVRRVVVNFCINELKKRENEPNVLSFELKEYSIGTRSAADEVIEKDTIDKISRYIDEMPESYRSVMFFKYVYEMNSREIGAVLGMSENTVRSMIRRGTTKLKKYIEEVSVV